MNNKRRASLKEAQALLDRALKIVESVSDEETDCLNNIPENLQMSEKYEKMEDAVDNLGDAAEHIDEAIESVSAAAT